MTAGRGEVLMEWFADEEFWTTFAPYIFSEESLRVAPDEVARVLALANVTQLYLGSEGAPGVR